MEKTVITEPIAGVPWKAVQDAKSPEFLKLAQAEGLHILDVERYKHPRHMAKVVDREGYLFIVAKAVRANAVKGHVQFWNIDFFIKPGMLLTIEDHEHGISERVCARFAGAGAQKPALFQIVYAFLDEIIDDYLLTLDGIGELVNTLETNVLNDPTAKMLQQIFRAKRSLIGFRKHAATMREVIGALLRNRQVQMERELENYFRDLYEHAIQVIEFIETYRDLLSGALDIYLSAVANRTNEVMKVLTIYGTIALPLVVITGFYGMNISLPLQSSPHALRIVMIVGVVSTAAVLAYFKKKNWF